MTQTAIAELFNEYNIKKKNKKFTPSMVKYIYNKELDFDNTEFLNFNNLRI